MKIVKIDENKIKVILTLDDLQERNIDLSALSYNSPQAQKLFMDMMHIAEEQHDFYVDDSQIFIEAVPVPPEGFEIIVTKVEGDKEFESIHKYIKSKLKRADLSSKKKSKKLVTNVLIYRFDSFDNLCEGVRHISMVSRDSGDIYKYDSNYYLVFPRVFDSEYTCTNTELTLSEFGEKVSDSAFFEGFLDEHGEIIIAGNAIGIVRKFFIK